LFFHGGDPPGFASEPKLKVMKHFLFAIIGASLLLGACNKEKTMTDLIVKNATVYTVDSLFSKVQSFAVSNGKIVAAGSNHSILSAYDAKEIIDLKGKFVYPGFIDAHCHFYGYGLNLGIADLAGSASTDEVIKRLRERYPSGSEGWITGRGWDQNLWEGQAYPDKEILDRIFPDNPVYLRRIDGHAAWVNSEALRRAGINENTSVDGGSFVTNDGSLTGILIDNAMSLIEAAIPAPSESQSTQALREAESRCFAVGLTAVGDAGLPFNIVTLIDSLQKKGQLKIRINAMLDPSDDNMAGFVQKGPYHTDHLTVRSIKLYADGALGSRGARMKLPYSDDPENKGLWVSDRERLEKICSIAYNSGYQVATHCIGDDANKRMLDVYASFLQGKNDRRWRIEHAQIVAPEDMALFGDYNIIPSVQTTHATSDMGWAAERLGADRMKGAYAYHDLLLQNGWLPNGSDFPVEDINPLYGFYAGIARKDRNGKPEGGFQTENALSRKEALMAMTIWAAKASFDEDNRGSIEVGKFADFVVTGEDIMKAPEERLFDIKVEETWLGGERVMGEK